MSKTPPAAVAPSYLGNSEYPFSITRQGVIKHGSEPLAPSHIEAVKNTIGQGKISRKLDPPLQAKIDQYKADGFFVEADFPFSHGLKLVRVKLQPDLVRQTTAFGVAPNAKFGVSAIIKAADQESGGKADIPSGATDARFFSALLSVGFNVQIIIAGLWRNCELEKGAFQYMDGDGRLKLVPEQIIASSSFKVSKGIYTTPSGFEIEGTSRLLSIRIERRENKAFTDPQLLELIADTFVEFEASNRPSTASSRLGRFGRR